MPNPKDNLLEPPQETSGLGRRGFLRGLSSVGALAAGALGGSVVGATEPESSKSDANPAAAAPLRPNDDLLFRFQHGVHSSWGQPNRPGQAVERFLRLEPGARKTIASIAGPGVVDRLWLTLNWPGKAPFRDSMLRNRSVIVDCYWDGAERPAVSAPLGDLFGHILGYDLQFENELFGDPSGRSFLCWIPMPFRKHARIDITNDFSEQIMVFPDVRFRQQVQLSEGDGYFHACWRRSPAVPLKEGHSVLPEIAGRGRYLGTHIGIISHPQLAYQWHGGNIAWFLDDDEKTASLRTTTLDDYLGSSWDYDRLFKHDDSGLLFSNYFEDGGGHHGMYCYHRRDLIQFERRCRVVQQRQVNARVADVVQAVERNPELATSAVSLPRPLEQLKAEVQKNPNVKQLFNVGDDLSTTALFYLDRPGGIADSCVANPDRRHAGWKWPAATNG